MNKALFLLTTLILTGPLSFATSDLKKIDVTSASVQVGDRGTNQAASFVDGSHNQAFINLLLADPSSLLSRLKANLEKENECDETARKQWYCGEVEIQGPVLASFGRGGWAGAAAGYRYMMGFRNAGSGRFFEIAYTFEVFEDVETNEEDPGDHDVTFTKTLKLTGARDIRKDDLNLK